MGDPNDDLYEEMSTKDSELNVIMEDDESGGVKSLSKKIDETPNMSDMQLALMRLFPENLGDYISNSLMVARIAPDAFLPLLHLLTKAEVAKSDPEQLINVEATMARFYILISKGLDGKGIIDILELAGAARDDEESDKLSKLLG